MASMQDSLSITAPPYSKVLLLGAIAAASAAFVTVIILVLCVGCQRKGKTHNVSSEGGKQRLMDMSILRQTKLRSISKSDGEMNKLNCNGKKSSKKNRPASMDLLLLPSRRSTSDLRSGGGRQLPQIPPGGGGEDGEHTYSEVGGGSHHHRSSSPKRGPDDNLYAIVAGRAGETDTPAPPAVPANTPAPPDPDGDAEEGLPESEPAAQAMQPPSQHPHPQGMAPQHPHPQGMATQQHPHPQGMAPPQHPHPHPQGMAPTHPHPQGMEPAEYACVRKLRKVDNKGLPQKRDSGTDMGEPPAPPPRHAPPSHPAPPPPHPHSMKMPRKNVEAFNLPTFPKEAVFMGNGEQYIWKPPEDDDITMLQNNPPPLGPLSPHSTDTQPATAAVSEMYSKVCKPVKKKRPPPSGVSPPGRHGLQDAGPGPRPRP